MNRQNKDNANKQNLDESVNIEKHNTNSLVNENSGVQVGGGNSFGFKPLQEDIVVEENKEDGSVNKKNVKRKREENSEKDEGESEIWRDKINRLICKYPGLQIRTSSETMELLSQFSLKELKNIHTNCINDTMELRGTPTSEFTLASLTYHINRYYVRGYTSKCLSDVELKREIEEEIITMFGFVNNKLTILFRMMNNLYQCVFPPDFTNNISPDPLFTKPNQQVDAEGQQISSKYIYPIEERDPNQEEPSDQEEEDENGFPPHPDDIAQRGNKKRKIIRSN